MRKQLFPPLAAILSLFLLGSSVWEGAAAVSGDFPEEGLYVATNSFPRNTVVDLTNLETGKTVRVIVSAGLDSPGLLALVSREAAAAVGLQSRAVGRIRMIQPSDPIAFSRFTEDYFRSGDPDYDPRAAVEEAGRVPGLSSEDFARANAAIPDKASTSREVEKDPESAWRGAPSAPPAAPSAAGTPSPAAGTPSPVAGTPSPVAGAPSPVTAPPSPAAAPPAQAPVPPAPAPVSQPPAAAASPPPVVVPPAQPVRTPEPAGEPVYELLPVP
ncbi:MAG: septal ring lytic transglycosylase RlpA family protein, partial [Treponema sp.]|nr:septal ring lytic transglycosylase RlpA family protein [Treponema sp.]